MLNGLYISLLAAGTAHVFFHCISLILTFSLYPWPPSSLPLLSEIILGLLLRFYSSEQKEAGADTDIKKNTICASQG